MIKQITKFTILFFMLFLSILPVTSTKIQINDTWIYEDNFKTKYNETALEIIQLLSENEKPIASVKTNTLRPFHFGINTNEFIGFEPNIELTHEGLYLTQEGGIPFIPVKSKISGQIYAKMETSGFTGNHTFYMKDMYITWSWSGESPATAFLTTDSVQFQIKAAITWIDFPNAPTNFNYDIYRDYLITSNSNIDDDIKNFTITETSSKFVFNMAELTNKAFALDEVPTAMFLSYQNGINQPIYIAQTEPVKTTTLSLSQTYRVVEYFLINEIDETTSNTDVSFITSTPSIPTKPIITTEQKTPFYLSFMILMLTPIIRKRKILI